MNFSFFWKSGTLDKFLILALVFLIPFTHKESFSVYDPDLVWSKFLLVICGLRGAWYFAKNYKSYLRDVSFVLLLAVLGFQVFSLLYTKDFGSSIRYIGFFASVVFLYPLIKHYLLEHHFRIGTIINTYSAGFSVVVLFLIRQIYLQENFQIATGGVWPVPGYPTRYGSTFWDVNHFGIYLVSLFFIFLGYAVHLSTKNIKHYSNENVVRAFLLKSLFKIKNFGEVITSKFESVIPFKLSLNAWFLYLAAVIIPFILRITGSRSSSLGFLFGLLVVGVLFINRDRNLGSFLRNAYVWLFAGLSVFFVYIGSFYFFNASIRAAFLYRSVSFYSHLFLLKAGIITGVMNPIGIGINAFSSYFQTSAWADTYYYIDKSALSLKLPLHNLWLEVWVETGVLSFIAFLMLWGIVLFNLFRLYKHEKDFCAVTMLAALVAFGVGGLFYSYKAEFFWFVFLLSAAYGSKGGVKNQFSNISINRYKVFRLISYLVVLVLFTIPFYFFTQPINTKEIQYFNLNNLQSANIIENFYFYGLNLTRYIIGNYAFTGRFFNLILYFSAFAVFVATFRVLRFHLINSLMLTLVIFEVVAVLFSPVGIVSPIWIYVFVVSICAFIISLIGKKFLKFKNGVSFYVLFIALILITPFYIKKNIDQLNSDFPYYLNFMFELAANKSKTNDAVIYVQEDAWVELADYYAASVETADDGSFYLDQNTILPANTICSYAGDPYDFGSKFIIVTTKDYACPFAVQAQYNLSKIEQGNFILYIFEMKKRDLVKI
ncbi:MAG: O-antigen ligase domain-containing protein [Niabella sp.]|nr:MAG: O-antigen ligase domain-containing protein [Niabella sp.]